MFFYVVFVICFALTLKVLKLFYIVFAEFLAASNFVDIFRILKLFHIVQICSGVQVCVVCFRLIWIVVVVAVGSWLLSVVECCTSSL